MVARIEDVGGLRANLAEALDDRSALVEQVNQLRIEKARLLTVVKALGPWAEQVAVYMGAENDVVRIAAMVRTAIKEFR